MYVDHNEKLIFLKIVYYGLPMAGKSTNFRHLYTSFKESKSNKLISHCPVNINFVRPNFLILQSNCWEEYNFKFLLYCCQHKKFNSRVSEMILEDLDGLLFIVDSDERLLNDNLEAFIKLKALLVKIGEDFEKIPLVVQLNKRDLADAVSEYVLRETLRLWDKQVVLTKARQNVGVLETFQTIVEILMGLVPGKFEVLIKNSKKIFY